MTIAQYITPDGSTSYVIGAAVAAESPVLTVESFLRRSAIWVRSDSSQQAGDLETRAIEANETFHAAIVERLATDPGALIDADTLM